MTARVLVVRLDGAGDVLLAGPAVRAVAARPGVEVSMLCSAAGAPAAALLPGVRRVLRWNCPWVSNPPPAVDARSLDGVVADLAGHRFDEAVILTSFHQSPLPTALVLRLAGIGRISGASVDYPGSLLDVRLRPGEDFDEDIPEPRRGLAIAAAAGYELPPGDDGRLAVHPPPPVAGLVGDAPYVVVHPGATAPARAWSPRRCAEAVRALAAAGHRVVVTGGGDERELTARVAGAPRPEVLDLGGRTELGELAAVIAGAEAAVVGNTGPAHLAAAVGTPVVSLFAPTVPAARWRPWRVEHELLGVDVPCAGCRARVCPVEGHPCLSGVSVSDVLAAVERLALVAA